MPSKRTSKTILLVNLGATFGGAEVYLLNLARLLQTNLSFTVLCSHPELQQRLHHLGIACVKLPRATGVLKPFQLVAGLLLLPYLCWRYQVRTVQINGYAEVLFMPFARMLGCRAVATRHLDFSIEAQHWWHAPGRYLARFLYQRLARYATLIVCVSAEVEKAMRSSIPPSRLVVIPNWVERIAEHREPVPSLRSRVEILFAGRLVPHKGLQVLLTAMRLYRDTPAARGLRLTVVGDGPYQAALALMASDLDVRFVGFQADVSHFRARADIFVSPSLGPEGSSLVALEAMAESLPCILSDLAVHRELSQDATAAMLFRSGDASDLCRCLGVLIEQDQVRTVLIQAARDLVTRQHGPATAATRYVAAFRGASCG